jgi:hypothetical protein
MRSVSPIFSLKGHFKSFLHKLLPDPFFYPTPVYAYPIRYLLIDISLIGKQHCLCPLPFLGAVPAPVDDTDRLLIIFDDFNQG